MKNKLELIETIKHLLSEHAEHPLVMEHQESLNKMMFLLNFNEFLNVEVHPSTLQKIQEIYNEVHSEELEDDKAVTARLPLAIKAIKVDSEIVTDNSETVTDEIVSPCGQEVETEIDSEVLISDAEKDFAQLLETSGLDALIKGEDDGVVIIYKTFGEKLFMTQFETLVNINLSEMEYDLATSFSAILEKEVEIDSLYIISFSDSAAVFVTDGVGNPILLGVYDSDKVGYFEG